MSLTTTCICLSKYLGIPIDVSNLVSQYSADETSKWITQYDTVGNLYRRINPTYFVDLSIIINMKPDMYSSIIPHAIVLNGTLRYDTARSVIQRRDVRENGDTEITIYTTVEIAVDVFEYLSITYIISSYTTPLRQFDRGTLYRPSEPVEWNKLQNITEFYMEDNVMIVNHTDVHMEYSWNPLLNIWEYVFNI